jgi:hypothetical protein
MTSVPVALVAWFLMLSGFAVLLGERNTLASAPAIQYDLQRSVGRDGEARDGLGFERVLAQVFRTRPQYC